ncbi:MAG: PEGA domain-containing protein [Oligoflexia bacterium]|nr:PEGA domain-containing protein [Oligoflexia bacterium]
MHLRNVGEAVSKRRGLFGSRPTLLLVDERPPGINLDMVHASALPALEDEPEENLAAPEEEEADEDSYDGGGPLRIFIGKQGEADGQSAVARDAASAEAATARASVEGPVWDASALAARADGAGSGAKTRDAPVLLKSGLGPDGPPPLTMSFGGSFSRGSLDAGVMDEVEGVEEIESVRSDTVVLHDQIFDRFLRFEDPRDIPPSRQTARAQGATQDDDEDVHEPVSLASVGGGAEEPRRSNRERSLVQAGPPPTRGLQVGLVRGPTLDDDEDYDDEDYDDEDYDDEDYDEVGAAPAQDTGRVADVDLDEDQDDKDDDILVDPGAGKPRVIIGQHDALPPLPPPPSSSSTPPLAPASPIIPDPFSERPSFNLIRDLVKARDADPPPLAKKPAAGPRTPPKWAARPKDTVIGRREKPKEDQQDGGGIGLIIFGILFIVALLVTWTLLHSADQSKLLAPTDSPALVPVDVLPGASAGSQDGTSSESTTGDASKAAVAPDADSAAAANSVPAAPAPAAAKGVVRIRATRPSRVYIDGRYVGQTPLSAQALDSGVHNVRVVAVDSGRTRTQDVRVDAGRSSEVRFSF